MQEYFSRIRKRKMFFYQPNNHNFLWCILNKFLKSEIVMWRIIWEGKKFQGFFQNQFLNSSSFSFYISCCSLSISDCFFFLIICPSFSPIVTFTINLYWLSLFFISLFLFSYWQLSVFLFSPSRHFSFASHFLWRRWSPPPSPTLLLNQCFSIPPLSPSQLGRSKSDSFSEHVDIFWWKKGSKIVLRCVES